MLACLALPTTAAFDQIESPRAVGWAKSLTRGNVNTQPQPRFCPRGRPTLGGTAREFRKALSMVRRAFPHPTRVHSSGTCTSP
jgi:hypothetical protein